jgi:hypothetical protein
MTEISSKPAPDVGFVRIRENVLVDVRRFEHHQHLIGPPTPRFRGVVNGSFRRRHGGCFRPASGLPADGWSHSIPSHVIRELGGGATARARSRVISPRGSRGISSAVPLDESHVSTGRNQKQPCFLKTVTRPSEGIVEAHESGVWTRPWEFLGISLEPSGEAYDDRDAVYFEVRDGLIRQTRVYITNNFARTYQIDKRIAELTNFQSETAG